MKTIKRFVFGIISSALLAMGLVRAADSIDPINRQLSRGGSGELTSTVDTSSLCNIAEHD